MATHLPSLLACDECGLVSELPDLHDNQAASCPRCDHTLVTQVKDSGKTVLACGITALIVLAVSCSFPFMAISVKGISQKIALLDALSVFYYFNDSTLASLLLITTIVLPVFYLLGLMTLFVMAGRWSATGRYVGDHPAVKGLFRFVFAAEPWLLSDIFFVAVLVSIIKMASMTDITVGIAFWTYFIFALLVIKCTRSIDKYWLCNHLFRPVSTGGVKAGDTHLDNNHRVCHLCQQINPITPSSGHTRCQRCYAHLPAFNSARSASMTLAFLIAAIIFYFPANLYPMMYTTSFGAELGSTIMDGVILLWKMGSYPVALVILTASIILPMTKMLILMHLLWVQNNPMRMATPTYNALEKLKHFRFIEVIGRWSMIDVFVVAILTSLIQFGELMLVTPGAAVFYFASVVVFTLLSAYFFDPKVLWVIKDGYVKDGHIKTKGVTVGAAFTATDRPGDAHG